MNRVAGAIGVRDVKELHHAGQGQLNLETITYDAGLAPSEWLDMGTKAPPSESC